MAFMYSVFISLRSSFFKHFFSGEDCQFSNLSFAVFVGLGFNIFTACFSLAQYCVGFFLGRFNYFSCFLFARPLLMLPGERY